MFSFDIGTHSYVLPVKKVLDQLFPGRLTLTLGDSRKTLPGFQREYPEIKCDLVFIDGGHFDGIPEADFDNFRTMMNSTSSKIVIIDECPGVGHFNKDIKQMWENKVGTGEAREIFNCITDNSLNERIPFKGFTIGQYILP